MTRGGTQKGGDPSRTVPSWRRSRARPEPERRGEADAGARCGSVGARECRDERLVRLRSPSRRRARRLRGWRGDHEPEPLEQDPQALALRVHPHDPPPAAAARALKDVQGEHSAQQRRPRRPRRWRTPGPGRRLRPRRRPLAWHHRRGSTPRNDRRLPRRGRPENPLKAKRMKATGRNQAEIFSISSNGSSSRWVAPSARGCGSSNSTCPCELSVNRSSARGGRKR